MKANMSKRSRALIIGGAVALALLVTTVVLYNKGSLFKFPGLVLLLTACIITQCIAGST